MSKYKEKDIDNLSAILDYCDRIHATYERIGESFDAFIEDADFRDAILMK